MSTVTLTRDDLEFAAAAAGLEDEALRTDYSGRGMYGQQCVGVIGDPADGTMFALKLSEEVEDVDFETMIRDTHLDSMGLQTITYWPSYQVEEEAQS